MLDISEVSEYIRSQPESSRIYIGGDSHRFKKNDRWYAEYTVVVVVHKEGNKGCKIFGQSDIQPDYDAVIHKPRMRLMNEVYKVADLYMAIQKVIDQRPVEIHLDINPDKAHGAALNGDLRCETAQSARKQKQGQDQSLKSTRILTTFRASNNIEQISSTS